MVGGRHGEPAAVIASQYLTRLLFQLGQLLLIHIA
jgi:hypothetical protein